MGPMLLVMTFIIVIGTGGLYLLMLDLNEGFNIDFGNRDLKKGFFGFEKVLNNKQFSTIGKILVIIFEQAVNILVVIGFIVLLITQKLWFNKTDEVN